MKKQNKTITIEKTSKKYKASGVIGGCVVLLGTIVIAKVSLAFGVFFILAGIATCLYAKIGAWWNNG